MSVPAQKITFAEMRATGVRGVLVIAATIGAATRRAPMPIAGPMTSGCPKLSRGSLCGLRSPRCRCSAGLAGGRKIAALSRYQLSAGNRCTIAPRQTSTTSSTRRVSARSVRAAWSLAMFRPRPPPLWAGSISRTSYRCRTDKDHRVPVGPRGQCLERGGRIPVLSAGGQRQLL